MAGTQGKHMLTGVIAFFIAEIMALATAVVGGSVLDILEVQMAGTGMLDVPNEWLIQSGSTYYHPYTIMVNIFYAMPYIMALLGLLILFVTIYHRYTADTVEEDEEDEYNAYMQQYNGGAL